MSKHREKLKRRFSSKLRQLRLLLLICLAAGTLFYWEPMVSVIQGQISAGKSIPANRAAALALPIRDNSVAIRKGIVFIVKDRSLKALKADGSLFWEKELKEPAESVIPSYDGVFVKPAKAGSLIKYSSMGKFICDVAAPSSFTHLYESINGILFENRSLRHYTWTDGVGRILGTQLIPEEYILKTTVDPESGDTVIATLKTEGGTLESALQRYDSSGRLTGARTIRDAVLLNMQFIKSQLIVVLDDRMISLNEQMKDRWIVREPVRYQAVSFGSEHFWVDRTQAGFQETQILQCYNPDGKVIFSLPFKDRLTLLEAGIGEQVAVVSGQKVQIYSEKGILNSEIQLTKVPEKIQWLNAKQLLIFYGDSIGIENTDKRNPL